MMMTTETVIYLICALLVFNAVMQCIIVWILIGLRNKHSSNHDDIMNVLVDVSHHMFMLRTDAKL
jgi:hypothetical protein